MIFGYTVPPPELRSFDNRLLRRVPNTPTGPPWSCRIGDEPGCLHLLLHHDDHGCLWEDCSCEEPGENK